MDIGPYRRVLALPGVTVLLVVGLVARIPVTAIGLTLTLHVVSGMGLGYTEAGLAGMASTLGTAVGAPLAGRFIDRHGLRPVLLVTTMAQLVFWSTASFLPYPVLLVAGTVAGVLSLPVFTVVRQCLAAMVPEGERRPAFALDSMGVEVSFMVGPALAGVAVTMLGSRWWMIALAAGMTASGLTLIRLNPPIRSDDEQGEERVPRRQWLTPGLLALLATVSAATFVLSATELSIVATLTENAATGWIGLVIGLWCGYSLIGGFVYGGLNRGLSPLLLAAGLCLFTVPVGLVGGGWWWLCLALVPGGLLCAPALSASIDEVSRRVPAGARGEAMGLHGTFLTFGVASGAPFAGALIDAHGSAWSYAAAGLAGIAVVLIALPFWRRGTAWPEPARASVEESVTV